MKKVIIKPEPTYNSELTKAQCPTLDETGNLILNNAQECLGAVTTGIKFVQDANPKYKFTFENINQRIGRLKFEIMALQHIIYKDLNRDENEEEAK